MNLRRETSLSRTSRRTVASPQKEKDKTLKRSTLILSTLIVLLALPSWAEAPSTLFINRFRVNLLWHEIPPYNAKPYVEVHHRLMKEMGAKWLRVDVHWDLVEPRKARHNWSILDEFFLKRTGFEYIFTIYSDAKWATGVRKTLPSRYPMDRREYREFLRSVVTRYKDQVKLWQIENEAELSNFWSGSKEEYVTLLKAAYKTIKGVTDLFGSERLIAAQSGAVTLKLSGTPMFMEKR